MTTTKIVPKCRYCDVDLFRVKFLGKETQYALVLPSNTRSGFSVNLYTCSKCGYIELFDNNPQHTFSTNDMINPPLESDDESPRNADNENTRGDK